MSFSSSKRRILIVASLVGLLIISIFFIGVLPTTFSDQVFSCRFEPYLILDGPDPPHPAMRVEESEGQIYNMNIVCIKVWYNNSYFIPIHITYNGFELLFLIYNTTVEDPTNVVKNNDTLVWGAFYNPHRSERARGILTREDYQYYVKSKDFNNYTKSIRPGEHSSPQFFVSPLLGEPVWHGQNLKDQPISPGTYYLYTVLYGRVANPQPYELIVHQVYWSH